METEIEDFKGEKEKKSDLVIVVAGPSKSGKSTLAEQIADELGITHYSAGDFFREIADERDMSVEHLSKKADKEVDKEVDRRTLEKGLENDCVIDSRIGARVLGDDADLTIYLDADLEERGRRLAEIEDIPVEEAIERVQERDEDNNRRYREYYGIEVPDPGKYDVVMDNTELSVEEQKELMLDVLEQRFPERTGGDK